MGLINQVWHGGAFGLGPTGGGRSSRGGSTGLGSGSASSSRMLPVTPFFGTVISDHLRGLVATRVL